MADTGKMDRNLALEAVRVTEAAALAAFDACKPTDPQLLRAWSAHRARALVRAGSYAEAIEVAQTQKARMLELRAALPMARMLRDTGRASAAMALLQPLFDWFQEGHQTPELVSCQELLAALKHNQADLAAETS